MRVSARLFSNSSEVKKGRSSAANDDGEKGQICSQKVQFYYFLSLWFMMNRESLTSLTRTQERDKQYPIFFIFNTSVGKSNKLERTCEGLGTCVSSMETANSVSVIYQVRGGLRLHCDADLFRSLSLLRPQHFGESIRNTPSKAHFNKRERKKNINKSALSAGKKCDVYTIFGIRVKVLWGFDGTVEHVRRRLIFYLLWTVLFFVRNHRCQEIDIMLRTASSSTKLYNHPKATMKYGNLLPAYQ